MQQPHVRMVLVFDLDDVLYDYDPVSRMRGISEATGLTRHELDQRWWNANGQRRADRGAWPSGRAQLRAMRDAGVDLSVAAWIETRRKSTMVRPATIAALRELRSIARTVVLSNNDALMQEHHRTIIPELTDVLEPGDFYTSARLGEVKPHPEVFDRLCAEIQTRPGDVMFLDDRYEAVEAARAVGIRSVHVRSEEDVLGTIAEAIKQISAH